MRARGWWWRRSFVAAVLVLVAVVLLLAVFVALYAVGDPLVPVRVWASAVGEGL